MDIDKDELAKEMAHHREKLRVLENEARFRRELGERLAKTIKARAKKPEGIASAFSVIAEGRTWEVSVKEIL